MFEYLGVSPDDENEFIPDDDERNHTYCEKPTAKNRPWCWGKFEDRNLFCKNTCKHMISCRRKSESDSCNKREEKE